MKAMLLALALACGSAHAQEDPGMAAQQAAQAAEQANQQAIQSMQAAQQAAQQNMQQAMDASRNAVQNSGPVIAYAIPPTFSVKAGAVTQGTTVRLQSSTHYAAIYFTTNGWMPTTSSRRYKGPITIHSTTLLQAIAVAPNIRNSLVARAQYNVPGDQPAVPPLSLSADGVLHAGARLHLVTASTVSSKTAQVGDPLSLQLDQDVKAGDTIVVPKGNPVEARITQSDPSGRAGTPGDLSFEVHSLTVRGTQVALNGGESLEGANHYSKAHSFLLIPVVGLVGTVAVHGDEAEIKPGMRLTATVAADTPLQP